MKMLGLERLKRQKIVVFCALLAFALEVTGAPMAFADLASMDADRRSSGASLEDRIGPEPVWEAVSISAGPSLSSEDVWNQATSWAQSVLTQSNDTYFNSRSFSSAYDDLWWLKAIQAPAAWGLSTGRGVTVAVVDTGVDYNHEDLAGNIWTNAGEIAGNGIDDDGNGYVDDWRGWDFANNDNSALDDNGHGTHVSGIVGALKDNGKGIAGVAPDSKIMAIKVLDKTGSGNFDNIIKGIRYAANAGARIINLSLGAVFDYSLEFIKTNFASYYNAAIKPLQDAILYAAGKGSLVIAASGNSGSDVNRSVPAGFTETLSVGATTPTESKAYFSNSGQTLDITAPGWDILSLRAAGTNMGTAVSGTTKYTRASGTSMATPVVSGVVALLLAQDPTLNLEGIERRLKMSAKDLGTAGFDTSFGYGQVDALNAITHDYYADGKLKTLWLLAADSKGMVRYDYDPAGKVTSSVDAAGKKHTYDSKGDQVAFYPSGRIKSRKDMLTGTLYEFLDEDLDGNGLQRLTRRTDTDGTQTDYTYWGTTVKIKSTRSVKAGVLVRTQVMDSTGRLRVETAYNGTQRTESTYSATGKVRQVTVWDKNKHVSVTQFYDSGVMSYQALFQDGRIASETFYSAAGKVLRVKTYKLPVLAPASLAAKKK